MRRLNRTAALALGVLMGSLTLAGNARAQEHETPPGPDEMQKKIQEIERLMRKAEEALARSTDAKSDSAAAEEKIEKLFQQKAQESTGKSAEELRKLAKEGSEEAAKTIEKLMKQAQAEARNAGEGVRKLLEETQKSGEGARDGMQWILDRAVQQGQGRPHDPQPQDPPKTGDKGTQRPEDNEQNKDPNKRDPEKPKNEKDPPRAPEFDVWLAELPAQVQQAYKSQDWDSIPPKWRDIIRAWTKKMADELEKGRR